MEQPVIICGLGGIGWAVLDYLRAAGLTAVAIDNRCRADDPRLAGVRLIQGDCRLPQVLLSAGVAQARGVIVLTSDDLMNISTTLTVRSLAPEARIVVRLFNQSLMARLGQVVQNVETVSVADLTAPILALTALTGAGLGTIPLTGGLRQVVELTAGEPPGLVGLPIAEIADRHRLRVLAHVPMHGAARFLRGVDPQARLERGDHLVVCGVPADMAPLLSHADEDLLPHLRWAGWLRRNGRVVVRTFSEVELPVKIATAVLLLSVLAGTIVYHQGMDMPVGKSLFRTISLMATVSHMHEEELIEEWQKVFASLVRLMGTALIAVFTAIITNYLVRARLGPALEIRRIPDCGHVVVCGLGNIGYRVVNELLQRHEQAVVIERAADNRFIHTVRRQGAAVLIGDATLPELLKQAHVEAARAVIACTDNQLANLEIALVAREINPRQHVVLRLADPELAQMLRDEANVRLALSTSALAAPAIVAGLFGERVPQLFLIAGRALAVVELTVQAGDHHIKDQTPAALAAEYRLLPLAINGATGQPLPEPWAAPLAEGDTLTAVIALPDLAQLLRRERAGNGRS